MEKFQSPVPPRFDRLVYHFIRNIHNSFFTLCFVCKHLFRLSSIHQSRFSNQEDATRTIGEILQAMWSHPWKGWKDVSKEDGDRMFERFKAYYQWESEWDNQVRSCWKKFIKRKFKDLLNRARENAKAVARKAGVEVGDDLSMIIPYKPRWMRSEMWEPLVHSWNTPEWKEKSSRNTINRGKSKSKHTLGSQTYVTLKVKADKILGRPATIDEIWMQSHGKKGTRPLDKVLNCGGSECSKEVADSDETDLQNNMEWVDSRAEESFRLYQEYIKEKYGDEAGKRPLFDPDTLVQGGKKKGKLFDISDPHVLMTGTTSTSGTSTSYRPARNEEVKWLNEKIEQLQQEKESERLEKEKEKAEKLAMMEQIEENRMTNNEMKQQIEFLLKNIPKS